MQIKCGLPALFQVSCHPAAGTRCTRRWEVDEVWSKNLYWKDKCTFCPCRLAEGYSYFQSRKKNHTGKGNSDVKLRIYTIVPANWLVLDFHEQLQISGCKTLAIFHNKGLLHHPKSQMQHHSQKSWHQPFDIMLLCSEVFLQAANSTHKPCPHIPQHPPLLKRKRFTKEL